MMCILRVITIINLLAFSSLGFTNELAFKKDLRRFVFKDSVGYSALITQNGKVLYQEALGLANIELNVPMQPNHIFEIGSLTKQFTAVAILLLAQDGLLSLDDNISKYIPDISTTKGDVTLKHLLGHTSGLVDPINNPKFLNTRIQESITLDELIAQFKNEHWQYVSGAQINYSNVGYSMLAWVIEQVSGVTYETFLNQRIFKPLKMHNTSQASFKVTKGKVTGYTFDGGEPVQHDLINLDWGYAAADLLSTPYDLSLFSHALMHNKVLNQAHLQILLSPVILNDGTQLQGSFTYSLARIGNAEVIRVSGSTLGYSCHSIYLPDTDTFIIALSNSDGVNGGGWLPPATVTGKLAATHLALPIPNYKTIQLSKQSAAGYIGRYQLDGETIRKLSFYDGKYYYQRNDETKYEVIPMENNSFYFENTLNYFQINKAGTKKRTMNFYYLLNNQAETALLIEE